MAEKTVPNYPDILGAITGGEHFDADTVHLALAVRPRVVRAGRSFEAVLLLQNCTDASVQVDGKLLLPDEDASGKPGRFTSDSAVLSVILRPAEVGYLALPITTLPTTTPGAAYKVAVAVEAQPLNPGERVRQASDAKQSYLPPETSARLLELKSLAFSTTRRGLFGTVIEAPFSVLPAAVTTLQPDWVSLWSPGDETDSRPLLEQFGPVLKNQILPELRTLNLTSTLIAATETVILEAGYPAQADEIYFIARLLANVLEIGAATQPALIYPGQEIYAVERLLTLGWPTDGSPIPLPNWCRTLLNLLAEGETAERLIHNVHVLTKARYYDLLRDAIAHGFHLLYTVTLQELGSEDDKHAYGDQLIEILHQGEPALTLVDVYLPLVLGGLIVDGRAGVVPCERVETITNIVRRHKAQSGGDSFIFDLIEQVLEWGRGKCR